jgi:hypothetical protein
MGDPYQIASQMLKIASQMLKAIAEVPTAVSAAAWGSSSIEWRGQSIPAITHSMAARGRTSGSRRPLWTVGPLSRFA